MKRTEIIELNGVEYTVELNRSSYLQIDKICNIAKTFNLLTKNLYDYVDEIDDNYVPEDDETSMANLESEIEEKEKLLKRLVENAFFIWLYPNHKLKISEVREIVKPYLEDEEKSTMIGDLTGRLLTECIEIRDSYNQELKNLKAQANK